MSSTYVVGDQPVPGAGYRLVSFLGRGGFGEVWKATAPGGAEAALKIIRLGSREGRKELRALQLVKRIHHTHLVPIIAFWIKNEKGEILDDEAVLQADGRETVPRTTAAAPTIPYDSMLGPSSADGPAELIIAMGLGEGNLYDRLEQCRQEGLPGIPDEELLGYLEDSAEAIDFLNSPMHDLGSGPVAIQHCDIKPHNLVIVGGSVQVCDFGLARMMGADRATTAAASIAYAAPECLVKGQPSATTDQYCLAVTFIELKTGQLPYGDLTMAAVMDAKRNDKLDFAMLPQALRPVLRRATCSDPAKRYGSCREMVDEMRRALVMTGADVHGAKGHAGRRAAVAVLALACAAGTGVWAWHTFLPSPDPNRVPLDTGHGTIISSGQPNRGSAAKPIDSSIVASSGTKGSNGANTSAAADPEGESYLASAKIALAAKHYAAAVTELEKARTRLPHDARVFSRLGAAWLGQQRWAKAVESYNQAITLEANDDDLVNRGWAHEQLNETDEAIADYTNAVQRKRGNAKAHVCLGSVYYFSKEDPQRAVAAFSNAITICETDPGANYPELNVRILRANAFVDMGKIAEAAADLTRACELLPRQDPQNVKSILLALDALIDACAKQHDNADAAKWAKKAAEIALDNATKRKYQQRFEEYSDKAAKSAQSKHPAP